MGVPGIFAGDGVFVLGFFDGGYPSWLLIVFPALFRFAVGRILLLILTSGFVPSIGRLRIGGIGGFMHGSGGNCVDRMILGSIGVRGGSGRG